MREFAVLPRLRAWVESGNGTVEAVQRACGVPPPASARPRTVSESANARDGATADARGHLIPHALFSLGAALGNEVFYISFLPVMFWEVDNTAARRRALQRAARRRCCCCFCGGDDQP